MKGKKGNYEGWSREDLVKEIEALQKQKTFGLVWESDKVREKFDYYINWDGMKTIEKFEEYVKKFPVLKESKSNDIQSEKSSDYNVLIEGDNYHALAVLNFTHESSVDLVYIDPPYNTGMKDFKYNDSWVDKEDSYRHSKWLSFMSKRLALAKNLLKKDGVIFISIDDNEYAQLKLLCDEIFGESNFVSTIIWEKKFSPQNDAKWFSDNHDYILVYARDKNEWHPNLLPRTDATNARYNNIDEDSRGPWTSGDLSVKTYSKTYDYPIKTPSGRVVNPPKGTCWRVSKERFQELVDDNRIWFGKDGDNVPRLKRFLSEVKEGIVPLTIWSHRDAGHNQEGRQELKKIVSDALFDNPKPTKLIKKIIQLGAKKDSLILDFFAGSGTTGQAVLELNDEDNGKRKFILCTNNENNICSEVCYPRISSVIKQFAIPRLSPKNVLNLKYFKTEFVDASSTDTNKRKIVAKSTEMLCLKENAFDLVTDMEAFKIFKNSKINVGIIFDEEKIDEFVKEAQKIPGKFNVYVFSFDESVPEKEFKAIKSRVKLRPIPEAILHVYRRVFKDD